MYNPKIDDAYGQGMQKKRGRFRMIQNNLLPNKEKDEKVHNRVSAVHSRQGIHQADYSGSDRKTEDITLWAMSSYSGQKGPA